MDTDEPARWAQGRLCGVLGVVGAVDWELEEIYSSLPEPADAEAMEAGERPRTLLHFVRSMVEGVRVEEVAALREALAQVVGKTAEELERQWHADSP